MKIPKLIALAVITLMAVGAMGSASTQVLAQSTKPIARQPQSVQAADPETVAGPDLDQVQEQVGNQVGPDVAADANGAASKAPARVSQSADPSSAPAIRTASSPAAGKAFPKLTASVTSNSPGGQAGTETSPEVKGETGEAPGIESQDPAPSGTPAISADAALKAAQGSLKSTAPGTATLDDENGKLIYSVDLNGSEVKVDAMTGTVLGVDQAGVDQGGDVQSGSNN